MRNVDYDLALIDENHSFGEVVFAANPSTPIPTCPGWSMLQLFRHVGRGDRWAAEIIRQGAGPDLDPRAVPDGRPPDDPEGARMWLHGGARLLIDTVDSTGPDAMASTFLGPKPARWWVRRRLHEATVHRADAALATGQPYDLGTDLAVDAIDEWLDLVTMRLDGPAASPLEGRTLTLEAVDSGVIWFIRISADGTACGRQPTDAGEADVRISGPATGIPLALTDRRTADAARVAVQGNQQVWATWLELTPF